MNPAPDLLLSLHDVDVRFGAVTALQAATLDLHRGERLALVGANGSGKSTMLRALHGLVATSSGRRVVSMSRPSGRPLVMAMLFQKPFMLDLSVRRNVLLALWLRYPLMTLKVTVAIHFEAARLWLKGVRVQDRHVSPTFSFSVIKPQSKDALHVR